MLCGFAERFAAFLIFRLLFSRGPMHSIAAGRAYAERIFDGAYITVNLRKFDMRRLVKMDRITEQIRA